MSHENNLIFDVSDLSRGDTGVTRDFHLEVGQDFDPKDFSLKGDISTDVTFLRTDHSIATLLENFTCTIKLNCPRCLKTFDFKIVIARAEREFLFTKPKEIEDTQDVYVIDAKHMQIDLHEMFRQEILLHCTPFQVCSTSCKGICPTCGKDKNKAACKHEQVERVEIATESEPSVKPLHSLRKLFKSSK